MPIYEYTCADCHEDFEFLVMRQDETVACEACGSTRVDKRFSVFGVGAATGPECGMSGGPGPSGCPPMGCGMPQCSPD